MNAKFAYILVPLAFSSSFAAGPQAKYQHETVALNARFLDAAKAGLTNAMIHLLKEGADMNARNDKGYTALHLAVGDGHSGTVQALVDMKADINPGSPATGLSALHEAAANGHSDCVRVLLKACLDNGKNGRPMSFNLEVPLQLAIARGHNECVKIFLAAKDYNNGQNVFNDLTPLLYIAARDGKSDCLQTIVDEVVLRVKAPIPPHVLGEAFQRGHIDCIKVLIKYSYLLVPTDEINKQLLADLVSATLDFENLNWYEETQDDLIIFSLDQIEERKKSASIALKGAQDAAVRYFLTKLKQIIANLSYCAPCEELLKDAHKLEKLVREGLIERSGKLAAARERKVHFAQ